MLVVVPSAVSEGQACKTRAIMPVLCFDLMGTLKHFKPGIFEHETNGQCA